MTDDKAVLTDAEEELIQQLIEGTPAEINVKLVNSELGRVLDKPHVLEALHRRVSSRLAVHGALAIENIAKIANDPKATPKTRLDAARDLASRAGYLPPKQATPGVKSLSEMTSAELSERIATLQREAADRAKAITIDAQKAESSSKDKG